ncbi:MAG: S4 domain-containing protein, partial [Balneolaceae bacterium]
MKPRKRKSKKDRSEQNRENSKKRTESVKSKKSKSKNSVSQNYSISEEIRINKFIAHAGLCSRREADALIADGKVEVNGKVVTELGLKVSQRD